MNNQTNLQKQRNEFVQSTQDLALLVLELQAQNAEMLEALKEALGMIEGAREVATSNLIHVIKKAEGA